MINESYMESCCRYIWQETTLEDQFYFPSEKFFTKRDLVTEEMEITSAKLEKVEYKFVPRLLVEYIIVFNL